MGAFLALAKIRLFMQKALKKTVQIRYYALLREERGVASETIVTCASTLAQLYEDLRKRHELSLSQERMSVAVNDSFANWSDPIADQDVIVFVPPVAGG